MPRTSYFTTTEIYLHLEEWQNAGLTSEECKEVIDAIIDPSNNLDGYFSCKPTGFNGNWAIKTSAKMPHVIEEIIKIIDMQLYFKLAEKKIVNGWKERMK
jgi:hypothetical protein